MGSLGKRLVVATPSWEINPVGGTGSSMFFSLQWEFLARTCCMPKILKPHLTVDAGGEAGVKKIVLDGLEKQNFIL